MTFILSHPTGNTFVRATARALHARGALHAFHTTVAAPAPSLLRIVPSSLRRQLQRRQFMEIPRRKVVTHPLRESVRLAASALGVQRITAPGTFASVDAVYEDLDRKVARHLERMPANRDLVGIYAYEDGAEHSFRAAGARGLARIYELPIAHWKTTQRLLHEEAERWPAWRATLRGVDDSREKLERKDRELAQADVVIVPSRFVLESLPSQVRQRSRCIVAPFGGPATGDDAAATDARSSRLRVLFAGALTQRKGLADLFEAMRLLRRADVELVVMGTPVAALPFYREQYSAFVYEPPRAHADVLTLMRTCDVLALPAIVEGRALVQQEALSCGLPLLVTANAGAEDLVKEGENGFVVPIRSPQVLAERIAWFADHRPFLPEMRREARRTAAAAGWSRYDACVGDALHAATARC